MKVPRREYSDPPVLLFDAEGSMVNLSAPPESLRAPELQERMSRVALDPAIAALVGSVAHGVVIGCGGTGWYVAMALAMSDMCRHIILYDADVVEEVNLNRLPVPPGAVGVPKATVLAAEIARVRPNQFVTAYVEWFPDTSPTSTLDILFSAGALCRTQSDMAYLLDTERTLLHWDSDGRVEEHNTHRLVFDCTDNPLFQNILAEATGRARYRGGGFCVHTRVSYDGVGHLTISHGGIARILDEQAGRYIRMPSWALPAQLAGVLGVYSALDVLSTVALRFSRPPLPEANIDGRCGRILHPTPKPQEDTNGEQEAEQEEGVLG